MQEKNIPIWKLNIYYKIFWKQEKNTPLIVILHGWWGKSESWVKVWNLLQKQWFYIIIPDLPGFWKTKLRSALTIEEYAIIVENFLWELKIWKKQEIILWGHSNGWAISIKIANRKKINISTLVLNNSAWIRNDKKRNIKRKIFKYASKIIKNLFPSFKGKYPDRGYGLLNKFRIIFYKLIWSHDYLNAQKDPKLKQTYLNIISSDLREEIKSITQNTLILWGEKDTYTPVSDGIYMRKHIKNAKMIIMENEKHGIHIHSPETLIHTFIHNL
jgi:pimeloyl-ACP methyl ester carboxylesterase